MDGQQTVTNRSSLAGFPKAAAGLGPCTSEDDVVVRRPSPERMYTVWVGVRNTHSPPSMDAMTHTLPQQPAAEG